MRTKWPWPGDSREDRARRIALSYRHLAQTLDAGLTALLDATWRERGEGWVLPAHDPLRIDDWLTAPAMAALFHKDAKTIYDWGRRHNIRVMIVNGQRHYCVGDVVAYESSIRARRAKGMK